MGGRKVKKKKIAAIAGFENVYQHHHFDDAALETASGEKIDPKGQWNKLIFKNDNPITLELACGKGEYTNLAKAYPDRNFVGVDLKGPRIFTGAKTALEEGLENVAFLRMKIENIAQFFEQAHLRDAYQEFVYRLTHAHLGCDVVVLYDGVWRHQAGTTRAAVHLLSGAGPGSGPLGDSRALLFMEHDTPLVVDEPIDFSGCLQLIEGGHLDVIRFHHESHVLPDHEYLMVDHSTQSMLGVPIRRTRQWSQRPHLASLDYYYRILREYFRDDGRTMIEDRMHSVCQGEPYERNRLAIYHPDGNIKRSYHLDGRGDEPKWDMVF